MRRGWWNCLTSCWHVIGMLTRCFTLWIGFWLLKFGKLHSFVLSRHNTLAAIDDKSKRNLRRESIQMQLCKIHHKSQCFLTGHQAVIPKIQLMKIKKSKTIRIDRIVCLFTRWTVQSEVRLFKINLKTCVTWNPKQLMLSKSCRKITWLFE